MKKLLSIVLALFMLFTLTACGGDTFVDDGVPDDFKIPLGDTGVKVAIPAEMGFEAYESKYNDFYGGGPNGEWRIIVNTDAKSEFPDGTLSEYADLAAQSNDATAAYQDENGNYYFTYVNTVSADEIYKNYTAVREGAENYYRVSFYCFFDLWDNYESKFTQWATTIEVE